MVNNYDLKTYSGQVTDGKADLDIGAVPAGMKRYITYIKLNNVATAAQVTLYESDVAAGGSGTNTRKELQKLVAGDTIMYPDTPDAERPILSIASEKYITMDSDVAVSTEVTFQYYDE